MVRTNFRASVKEYAAVVDVPLTCDDGAHMGYKLGRTNLGLKEGVVGWFAPLLDLLLPDECSTQLISCSPTQLPRYFRSPKQWCNAKNGMFPTSRHRVDNPPDQGKALS